MVKQTKRRNRHQILFISREVNFFNEKKFHSVSTNYFFVPQSYRREQKKDSEALRTVLPKQLKFKSRFYLMRQKHDKSDFQNSV